MCKRVFFALAFFTAIISGIFVAHVQALNVEEATIIYAKEGWLLVADHKSGTIDTMWESPGYYDDVPSAYIAPDGKTIAVRCEQDLYIMNNDGSNIRKFNPSGWPPTIDDKGRDWYYTSKGVFWNDGGSLKRFVPETEQTTRVNKSGNAGPQSTLWMSADGRKGFTRRHVLFTVSSDYSSAEFYDTDIKGCVSGHGNTVTAGGSYVCYNGFGHKNLFVVPFTDELLQLIRNSSDCPESAVGTYSIPTYELTNEKIKMTNWFAPRQVVNHDTLVLIAGGYVGPRHWAIVNILDSSFVYTAGPEEGINNLCNGYVGPLPEPDRNAPYLSLDKESLVFSAMAQQPPAQDVIVKNSGTGTLSQLSIKTDPSSVSWFELDISDNGTDTVTISNTVKTSVVSDGEYTCSVIISGGGATNDVEYSVTFTKGGNLAPPNNFAADITGDSLQTVTLTWTDNTSDEDGFVIERIDEDSTWQEIARTKAGATEYADENVALGTFNYRIRAYKDGIHSSYATLSTPVTVSGIPWIKITQPSKKEEVIKPGSTYAIKWHTNKINNIRIFLTYGIEKKELTGQGGIEKGQDSNWGNYQWSVPDTQITAAKISVQQYGPPNLEAVSGTFSISDDNAVLRPEGLVGSGTNSTEDFIFEVYDSKGRLHARIPAKNTLSVSALKRYYSSKGVIIIRKIPLDRSQPDEWLQKKILFQ